MTGQVSPRGRQWAHGARKGNRDSLCSSKLCTASLQSLAMLPALVGSPRDVFPTLRAVPLLGSELTKAATGGSGFQG